MNDLPVRLRPAPPLLVSAGLLLWGWQNNFLVYALFMAVIMETVHWVNWRWPVTDREFNNLTDLSGVGFFIVVVYIFVDKGAEGIYTILSIIPFVLFLLVLIQLYSEKGRIKLSALFISLRRLDAINLPESSREIDLSLPYFITCIISASAGNNRTFWFFTACCLLLGTVLWFVRPGKRYRIRTWIILLLISFGIAYAGQIGIRNLQSSLERNFISVFDRFMWRFRDPDRATTAIGSIGRLKLSDRILIRIKPEQALTEPIYLYEAAYNSYNYGVWSTTNPTFELIDPDFGKKSWTLNDHVPDRKADISVYMVKETGVIPIPQGTTRIRGEGIVEINRNNNGAIRMEIREGWVKYTADYQNQAVSYPLPGEYDLTVKDSYRADFDRLADELNLQGKPPGEVLKIIKKHFTENYFYSLSRRQMYPRQKYLADFLFNSKRGHCEFFATSTVLLLRSVGIPARYAVGYATQEYSRLEGQYVARSRHAHSWALAFVEGNWVPVDSTPSVWAPEDEKNASSLQPFIDLFSWISFQISRWQSGDELEDAEPSYNLLWLLIPLGLLLFWRLYFKERIQLSRGGLKTRKYINLQGKDSDFYRLTERLEAMGYVRQKGETLYRWLNRIESVIVTQKLMDALKLHYQYRFDPGGLQQNSKEKLYSLVTELMNELKPTT